MSQNEAPATPPRGLIDRIAAAYWNFSGSSRALLAERPSDATLLSFMVIAAVIGLCGDIAAQTIDNPGPRTDADLDKLSGDVIGRLLIFPLGVYFLSALASPIARAFGGVGGWYETRLAFAWSAVLTAPWAFAVDVIAAVARASGADGAFGLEGAGAFLAASPLMAVILYVWAGCVAGVHEFSSTLRVALTSAALAAAIFGATYGVFALL